MCVCRSLLGGLVSCSGSGSYFGLTDWGALSLLRVCIYASLIGLFYLCFSHWSVLFVNVWPAVFLCCVLACCVSLICVSCCTAKRKRVLFWFKRQLLFNPKWVSWMFVCEVRLIKHSLCMFRSEQIKQKTRNEEMGRLKWAEIKCSIEVIVHTKCKFCYQLFTFMLLFLAWNTKWVSKENVKSVNHPLKMSKYAYKRYMHLWLNGNTPLFSHLKNFPKNRSIAKIHKTHLLLCISNPNC